MIREHQLKTWTEYFQALWTGEKTFELRKNDRDFKQNDRLTLREYDPQTETYSGRRIYATVGYVLYGGQFGLSEDMCIMSIVSWYRLGATPERAEQRQAGGEA